MLISIYLYKFLFIYSYICNIYTMPCNFLVILIRVLDCDTPLHILPLIHSSLRWIGYNIYVLSNLHPHLLQMKYIIIYKQSSCSVRILIKCLVLEFSSHRFSYFPFAVVKAFSDLYKTRAKTDLFKTANSDLHKNILAVTYLYIAFQNTQSTESVFVPERETIRWQQHIFVDRM